MTLKLAIVEDDSTMREAMESVARSFVEVSDVYVFPRAEDFLEICKDLRADVVLMDIELPGMSGIECVGKMKALAPFTQVVMCTVFEQEDKIFDSICAGASGYIVKNSSPEKIREAIVDAQRGGSPMTTHIARKVVEAFRKSQSPNTSAEILTLREKQILEHLSKGLRYKEIASNLDLSPDTIRTHIRNIYEKLQVQSRMEAVNKVYGRR
ncbi:MAG: response regulator transcription factor [Flavobacteriales bacterium]|nr:response regulator transcription factor [Flavobacteriales bacterium]